MDAPGRRLSLSRYDEAHGPVVGRGSRRVRPRNSYLRERRRDRDLRKGERLSDPGLFTHLYAQLRHCGELIDTVIVDLETTGGSSAGKQRGDLSRLLRSL